MPLQPPSLDDLRQASTALGLGIDDADLAEYRAVIAAFVPGLDRIEELAAIHLPTGSGPRRNVAERRPDTADNPLGAWYWRCSVSGGPEGVLAGRRVVLKDNIALAGVPMMDGSALLDGYVPDYDATVATRVLQAGGEIVGKAVCEDLCLSAGSHTAATGPVRNPHDPSRSAGGSSSGCAALVAAGECDVAIGGDQGGSIRVPSALCGCYGLKPTYGLVPYTGAISIDATVDHLGPIGRSSADVAALLEAIAGEDGHDPRQRHVVTKAYTKALSGDVRGLRIGMVEEGFAWGGSDPQVDALVWRSGQRFAELGAEVTPLSIPWHRDGGALAAGILGPALVTGVFGANAVGTDHKGPYPVSLADWLATTKGDRAPALSPNVKAVALMGHYLNTGYGSRYYGWAHNLAPVLGGAYDEALRSVDLLLMPTSPTTAGRLPAAGATITESIGASFRYTANTSQFDVSGHPAMSVPCGTVAGLPVGMMLIGRPWEDNVVLQAAHAFEQLSR